MYYLRARDRIEIGTSGNPRRRLAQLHFDELLAFERGDRALEQRRHRQFTEFRIAGTEWFPAHNALAGHVRELSAGAVDAWDRYAYWTSRQWALRGCVRGFDSPTEGSQGTWIHKQRTPKQSKNAALVGGVLCLWIQGDSNP